MSFGAHERSSQFHRQGFLDASHNRQPRVDGIRKKRRRRSIENVEFRQMLGRLLRAFVRRVGDGDPDDLVLAVSLAADVELVLRKAVARQRAAGASWAQIARQLGCTKQAAQQRFGRLQDGPPAP